MENSWIVEFSSCVKYGIYSTQQFFSSYSCFVVIHSSVDEVKTASDTQRGADSDSSIPSLSKAEGRDDSMKDDSISEELEDYTLDETMTEDEMERSFRSILPSESHRKRAKKQLDNVSVTSDEGSVSGILLNVHWILYRNNINDISINHRSLI